jgi:hypothetical protein
MTVKKLLLVLIIGVALAAVPAWSEEGKLSENAIDIGKLTCKELMSGSDIDREVGIAFFHGYMAGKKNQETIDLPAASARSDKVKDFCLSNPTSTVMDGFLKPDK